MTSAAQRWSHDLEAWAIPDEILEAAPQSPWIHPVELFTVGDEVADSPSHRRAREALPRSGSVLDVGCGGGRAAFALVPPADHVIGVDHQAGMLEQFALAARARGVTHEQVVGDWPDVAARTPVADVVVCHHVAYNVADLAPFLLALGAHARRRVVLEIPTRHPLASMAPLWRRFWALERPEGPTSDDCLAVAREAGLDAHAETFLDTGVGMSAVTPEQQARFTRIRLCLPEDRETEVAEVLARSDPPPPRQLTTLWWDVEPR